MEISNAAILDTMSVKWLFIIEIKIDKYFKFGAEYEY